MPVPDFSAVDLNLNALGSARHRPSDSEFGRPIGYVDPTAYRGKAASESLASGPQETTESGQIHAPQIRSRRRGR